MRKVNMRKMKKNFIVAVVIIVAVVLTGLALFYFLDSRKIGKKIDSYKGVDVYYNGLIYTKTFGKNYSKDGYYYGLKWQCVEYVKRFYYDAKNHRMPEVYGHAKDYFDKNVPQGGINKQRNLLQYRNGEDEKPQVDDLLVFNDTKYGHVAIIIEVGKDYIEVIQQNILGRPRQRHVLKNLSGKWFVGEEKMPSGWLRKK
jgi:surface antigen